MLPKTPKYSHAQHSWLQRHMLPANMYVGHDHVVYKVKVYLNTLRFMAGTALDSPAANGMQGGIVQQHVQAAETC